MSKLTTEEKSPLLFVLDTNEDLSRYRNFDNRRSNGISSGATAVFTHFPDYIGTCWITTAVCGLLFFMMILLVLSTMTAVSMRIPRCVATHDEPINNTIHLVHMHDSKYPEVDQVKIVKDLMTIYPNYNIRILSVITKEEIVRIVESNNITKINETKQDNVSSNFTYFTSTLKPTTEKKKAPKRRRDIDLRFLDMLLGGSLLGRVGGDPIEMTVNSIPLSLPTLPYTPIEKQIKTIEELVEMYPQNITYENTTFNQQFIGSPLYPYYTFMNEKLQIFSVRVMQIWQYGGISYDLLASKNKLQEVMMNKYEKIHNFVISEKEFSETGENGNVIEGPVVNVDDRAIRLESKVPCHVFFGQLLTILRKTNKFTTVKQVMHMAIKSFCKHYAPNLEHCHLYMNS